MLEGQLVDDLADVLLPLVGAANQWSAVPSVSSIGITGWLGMPQGNSPKHIEDDFVTRRVDGRFTVGEYF